MKKEIYTDLANCLAEREEDYLTLKSGVEPGTAKYGDIREMTAVERKRYDSASEEVQRTLEKLAGCYDGWLEDKKYSQRSLYPSKTGE